MPTAPTTTPAQTRPVGPQTKLRPDMPVDTWIDRFLSADPNRYKQFKNKNPQKKTRMAISAYYAAKNPSKKRK